MMLFECLVVEGFVSPPCAGGSEFEYEPGPTEREWLRAPAAGRICEVARGQANAAGEWLRLVNQSITPRGHTHPPNPHAPTALSRLRCSDGRTELIEPLTGIGRHPFARVGCQSCRNCWPNTVLSAFPEQPEKLPECRKLGLKPCVDLFDVSYLLPQSRCGLWSTDGVHGYAHSAKRCNECTNGSMWHGERECSLPCSALRSFQRSAGGVEPTTGRGRNLLFDLGSGAYSSCRAGTAGCAIGSSLPFFEGLYARACILFDKVYAWESVPMPAEDFWWDVPLEMRGLLTFFNMGVKPEPPERGAERNSFLGMLEVTAKPDDFVVIKVDIDHPATELSIVRGILASDSLTRLVDELFFEFHFTFDDLDFGWGGAKKTRGHSVDDALELMQALRRKGIRTHFWV